MGSPLTERARELRREMTALETIVWFELKGKKLDGYKFRRQAPIGPYIADFYCPAARLVVEIDGPVHNDRQARDEYRTRYLAACGIRVIRFRADEPRLRMERVLEAIVESCRAVRPHPSLPAERGG